MAIALSANDGRGLAHARPARNTTRHGAVMDKVEAILSVAPFRIARILDLKAHILLQPVLVAQAKGQTR